MIDGPCASTAGDDPEQLLFFDNGQAADCRIIAFASPPAMRLLAAADTWFIDGNFAMAPRGCMQLYVIRVPLGTTAVTTVYTLLERKSQQFDQDLFQAVLDYCETLELPVPTPATVLCNLLIISTRPMSRVPIAESNHFMDKSASTYNVCHRDLHPSCGMSMMLLSTGNPERTTSARAGTTDSFIWWATIIHPSGHLSKPLRRKIAR